MQDNSIETIENEHDDTFAFGLLTIVSIVGIALLVVIVLYFVFIRRQAPQSGPITTVGTWHILSGMGTIESGDTSQPWFVSWFPDEITTWSVIGNSGQRINPVEDPGDGFGSG